MSKAKHWNERFALIQKYNPTDHEITQAFGIKEAELNTARELLRVGTLVVKKDMDFDAYGNPFENLGQQETVTSTVVATKKFARIPSVTSTAINSLGQFSPETATKRKATTTSSLSSGRRGRKGDKIAKAFQAVPSTPTPIQTFAKQHNISVPVLRQSKRFDLNTELGNVRVKMNKESGILEIWREKVE